MVAAWALQILQHSQTAFTLSTQIGKMVPHLTSCGKPSVLPENFHEFLGALVGSDDLLLCPICHG